MASERFDEKDRSSQGIEGYGGEGPHWAVVPMKKKKNNDYKITTINELDLHFFSMLFPVFPYESTSL